MTAVPIELLAIALLPAVLLDLVLARRGDPGVVRVVVGAACFAALLVPWGGSSAAQQLRGLLGDLSMSSTVLLVWYVLAAAGPAAWRRPARELVFLAALLVAVAPLFYLLSLGVSRVDPYAHGYYPTVLSALLLAGFLGAVGAGWTLTAALVATAYVAFIGGWLESDNLWDYLFDVPLVVAAAVACALNLRTLATAIRSSLSPRHLTIGSLVVAASFLLFAVVLSRVNPRNFAEDFTVEDGFIEWTTAIVLFAGFCVGVRRFVVARHRFDWRGKAVLIMVAAVCLFGAGEEISWGQRVFDIATPAALAERNAQRELNLHNLTFEWNGRIVKVNRLVFGRGLAIGVVLYLFVLAPLYRRNVRVRALVDAWAIPIPTTLQTVAYAVTVAVVEGLIASPKRGEMTEFAGAIVIVLNIAFPLNRAIYGQRPPAAEEIAAEPA